MSGTTYKLLEASNGEEAIQLCGQYKGPVGLLLTEVVMPPISARQFASSLQAEHPEMKVLYMSGCTNGTVVKQRILNDAVAFVQKPFTPEKLLTRTRKVISFSGKREA